MPKFEVIYVTGAPASGKTTFVRELQHLKPSIKVFHYSELLADYLSKRYRRGISHTKLRKTSAFTIATEDIEEVDKLLIKEVTKTRKFRHVLVDSHPVTKEKYGFRITAFSLPFLRALNPTRVCILY